MSACPSCSRDVAEGFAFCPHCGARLAPDARASEVRKLVTILFADVTGSTQLGEQLDPERLDEVISAYFDAMRREIEAQGGTVEKFIGDAVMAVFGVPTAHEDDAARALRAALGMRRALDELNTRLERDHGLRLAVRVGVNTGEVLAASTPTPGERLVTGDPVNVAARLEQLAEPGQVVVAARTAAAARGFDLRPMGERQLRGKQLPTDVFELAGEREAGAGRTGARRTPLIGREAELGLLRSLYERVAAERQPMLVTIYGQAGVGKSRLTWEFLDWTAQHEQAPRVVRGRCLAYGSGVTFWPLVEILRDWAGFLDTDPADVVLDKLTRAGASMIDDRFAVDPQRTLAFLAHTIGVTLPTYELEGVTTDQLRSERRAAWRSFFSALAAAQPVVAVVEDIHWADDPLLELLEEIAERVDGGVLVVAPSRPELTDRRPGWGGGRRRFSSIALEPLSEAASGQLIAQLLEVERLPPAIGDRIVERAEGNPFFVEEMVRVLLEEGRLRRGADGWTVEAGWSDALPDTIQGVLAARIDLLPADEKRALQAAAVVGRTFWPAAVDAVAATTSVDTLDALRHLEERDLVRTRLGSSMAGQTELIFKHVLIRDVAYESIPRRDRSAAHAGVAHWIEAAVGARVGEFVELVAHHYAEAVRFAADSRLSPSEGEHLRAQALDYLLRSGQDAVSKRAFDRVDERTAAALGLTVSRTERARVLEVQAAASLAAYRGDDAWRRLTEAIENRLQEGPSDAAARMAIARLCGLALDMPLRWPGLMHDPPAESVVRSYLDLGMRMVEPGDSEERTRLLMATSGWPFMYQVGDKAAAFAAGDEAPAMALRLAMPALASAALDYRAGLDIEEGNYAASWTIHQRRLELVPSHRDLNEIADVYAMGGWTNFHLGNYRRGFELADTGFDQLGVNQQHCLIWRTANRFRLGEWDAMLEDAATLEALRAGIGLLYHEARVVAICAFVHHVRGETDIVKELFDRLAESRERHRGIGISAPRPWMAQVLARSGRLSEAWALLDEPDPSRERQNRDVELEARAELIAIEGRWDEADALVRAALELAAANGHAALPAFADRLAGRALTARGRPADAVVSLRRSVETLAALEAPWERACSELPLADALVATGADAEAAAVLDAAVATFTALRASEALDAAARLRPAVR